MMNMYDIRQKIHVVVSDRTASIHANLLVSVVSVDQGPTMAPLDTTTRMYSSMISYSQSNSLRSGKAYLVP